MTDDNALTTTHAPPCTPSPRLSCPRPPFLAHSRALASTRALRPHSCASRPLSAVVAPLAPLSCAFARLRCAIAFAPTSTCLCALFVPSSGHSRRRRAPSGASPPMFMHLHASRTLFTPVAPVVLSSSCPSRPHRTSRPRRAIVVAPTFTRLRPCRAVVVVPLTSCSLHPRARRAVVVPVASRLAPPPPLHVLAPSSSRRRALVIPSCLPVLLLRSHAPRHCRAVPALAHSSCLCCIMYM
ncbi:hypothetical protein DENSPDRAFT_880168 [Dentipellis sp. KUC8613]|nr:hypothetical protein DENSPDRAFT_880168 [Dentipellis sp. KUC8613]